ncbi:MAG: DUF2892 domain-containing protein [Gammaproteobacteria bacterium]|jgi:hypothetical protein
MAQTAIQGGVGLWQLKWDLPVAERWYRLFQGVYLLIALYAEHDLMIYGLLALLSFEVLTNLPVPLLVSRIRFGNKVAAVGSVRWSPFTFNSERMLRIVVIVLLILSCVLFPEPIWFIPWFVAAMLLLAGITNICPMVMMFQRIGLS